MINLTIDYKFTVKTKLNRARELKSVPELCICLIKYNKRGPNSLRSRIERIRTDPNHHELSTHLVRLGINNLLFFCLPNWCEVYSFWSLYSSLFAMFMAKYRVYIIIMVSTYS